MLILSRSWVHLLRVIPRFHLLVVCQVSPASFRDLFDRSQAAETKELGRVQFALGHAHLGFHLGLQLK